jgi:ketosteroid isomerase-like protein
MRTSSVRAAAAVTITTSLEQRIVDLFQAIDARRWDLLEEMLTDDVEYERPGYPPFIGRERVLRFYREERVIASGQHAVMSVVVQGNLAACSGQFHGVHKDGSSLGTRFADVYEFRDQRIRRRASYFFTPTV